MTAYAYPSTERVLYGVGSVGELPEQCARLGVERALLLSTPSLAGSRVEAGVRDALGERCAAVSLDCAQHVPSDVVDRLIQVGRELAPDAIVTVGGGSVTDAAKALAAALADGIETAAALRARRIVFEYPDSLTMPTLDGEPVPIVAVPTTLSAAEYDGIFGMTHAGTKDLYLDVRLAPRSVVLDPEATHETPDELWAASGIRALDHAIEIYLSQTPTPVTDAASLHAVRLLFEHLPRSLEDPTDDAARLSCLQAGWLSMLGVDNVTLGLSHGIGHQIGARCGVPHGVTSCVMLPTVLARMVDVMPRRLADLAAVMDPATSGEPEAETAARAPELVREFVSRLGLPTRLSEVGVGEDDFDLIADDAMADFVVAFAPVEVSKDQIRSLLIEAA
jgi:alcohol dehydrogenase class IV